ncbi:MAG: HesA/MoeB/ThiF family protein [Candidatus Binatia bacterium]
MFPDPFYHATMVVGQNSLDAHYYDRALKNILPIRQVVVVGAEGQTDDILKYIPTSSYNQAVTPSGFEIRYERQASLLGAGVQALLPKVAVGVVGLGGLGSFVALELAYLGVGQLVLVDSDVVEMNNLNRMVGAQPNDVGRHKVEVLAKVIKQCSPGTEVTAVAARILDSEALDHAKSVDLLLGCVDNHGARLTLNHLAVRYLIPLIDAGTGTRLESEGVSSRMGGQVQLVAPGVGCLECRGFIDPQRAAFDLAPADVQEYERAHGYGTEEAAPSVIFLNGVVASMQVAEAVRLLGGTLNTAQSTPRLIMYDAGAQSAFVASLSASPDCATCGLDGVTGVADLAPLCPATSTVGPKIAATIGDGRARSYPNE